MPCVELSLCTDGIRCTLPFCAQAWLRRRVAPARKHPSVLVLLDCQDLAVPRLPCRQASALSALLRMPLARVRQVCLVLVPSVFSCRMDAAVEVISGLRSCARHGLCKTT